MNANHKQPGKNHRRDMGVHPVARSGTHWPAWRPHRLIGLVLGLLLGVCIYSAADGRVLRTRINQLSVEVERRVQWWDWRDTPEEVFCRSRHDLDPFQEPIPNVVHFIYVTEEGKQVELFYAFFLALKAAVLRMDAAEIKLHTYGLNTENPWWREIGPHVTHVIHRRDEFPGPRGLPLSSLAPAHQTDILRLAILRREGGIYLDADAYTLKSFADLLHNPRDTVMGHEGGNRYGLCNAIIVSRARSEFLARWQDSYQTFDPAVWNQHSVRRPKLLQVQNPDLLCPLSPTAFFWPTWAVNHIHYMHDLITPEETAELRANMSAYGGAMYANQLAFHAAGARDWLKKLTPEDVLSRDTRFNVLLREIAAAPL